MRLDELGYEAHKHLLTDKYSIQKKGNGVIQPYDNPIMNFYTLDELEAALPTLERAKEYGDRWEMGRIETYWYYSGRNAKTYVEITFFFNPYTLEITEKTRKHTCLVSDDWKRPEWARCITTFNEQMSN